jgi:hypothetical protein
MSGRFLRILLPAKRWANMQYSDRAVLPPPNQARVDCGRKHSCFFGQWDASSHLCDVRVLYARTGALFVG